MAIFTNKQKIPKWSRKGYSFSLKLVKRALVELTFGDKIDVARDSQS